MARLFEELRIDYCCGGQLTLAEVCSWRPGRIPPASTADPWRRRSSRWSWSTARLERC
ncbi:DUF542 domain-containing protein [Synechococcus sp. CS-602]|uniref:DUF542 domain-containing protein n=1 Tax=unclassified Synechococcus TaxID=2626047 RepID=UPI0009FB3A90|nr:DUF542 domain-containing protein [Synechococcus sp. CS-603]MCT0204905.1 DUF542 domain-containing protein [Synechococcus sp. CS-602]MCT0245861.1 DUF542 domain-containing protein [Synechococcus sp. CS-601]